MADWIMDHTIALTVALLVLTVALVVGIIAWDGYVHRNDVCEQKHWQTSTTYVMAGNVPVPVTSTYEVCDKWVPKYTSNEVHSGG